MLAGQRRTRDLILIGAFIVLLVFLLWPSGDDERESDAAPDDLSVVETPTPGPTPTATPIPERELACEPGDATRVLNRWVAAFNNADLEGLDAMLPDEGMATPSAVSFPGMDRSILHSFRVHESGVMSQPADVLDYLETRVREHQERWRIDDVELYRMGRSLDAQIELDRATARFTRTADDLPDHEVHGTIIINCFEQQVLLVDLISDLPELALPIPVDDFLGAVGPYGTGEMRDLRMIISTDFREDTGTLMQWDLRRLEANDMSGNYVEAMQIETLNGNRVIDYVYSQPYWYLDQRGWKEVGEITGWSVLPLEIMLTRTEPSTTADVLREHIDDIPEVGFATFTGEFEIRPALQEAAEMRSLPETIEGIIEVDVEDGNVVTSRYRLVDQVSGVDAVVPEIRWLHIVRRDRFDPGAFLRPQGFERNKQQYIPAAELDGQIRLVERLHHEDDEGIGELFELDWDGESYEVLVMPSRGRSHEESRGDDWPVNWEREMVLAGGHPVILAGPVGERFPHAALWDTRRFRYELRIDPASFNDPDRWGVQTVGAIAEALLAGETSPDGLRWLGP